MENATYIVNGLPEFLLPKIENKTGTVRVIKPGHNAGIFSYIWVTLQSMYSFPNDKYYVDMRKFSGYYDPTITKTDNVWEYFFEQPDNIYEPPKREDIIETGCWNGDPNSGYCDLSVVDRTKKLKYNELIKKYVRPLPHIREKIDNFLKDNNFLARNVLGVHCRGTDSYLKDSVELYIKEINLIEKDYDTIFLMSDDQDYFNAIKSTYKDKVINYDSTTRGKGSASVFENASQPYKVGEDAIVDSFIMSNAKFLLHPRSNVTYFSRYLNPDLPYLNIDMKHGNTR